MKTINPLYYARPYCSILETNVLQHLIEDRILWVSLEETIIYPGGGGQPMDKAFLNDIPVQHIKKIDKTIFYGLDPTSKLAVWNPITLRIDSTFRFYNMQQHSGQHLLSAVFSEAGYTTVSAHLGETYTSIEIDGGEPSPDELSRLEDRCNQIIRSALSIKTYWVDQEKARTLPLRKPAGDLSHVRIVQLGELDYSACAGTHVAITAEIGLIKIIGIEKIRGHVRIKAKIGQAAMKHIDQLQKVFTNLQQTFDAPVESLIASVQKHLDEKAALNRENKNLRSTLANAKASILNNTYPKGIIAVQIDENDDAKLLCRELTQTHNRDAFLLTSTRFFFARCAESNIDFKAFIQGDGMKFELRGGGPPTFMQGLYKAGTGDMLLVEVQKTYAQ